MIIDAMRLNSIVEVHERTNCGDKSSRCRSADHAHNATLNVAVNTACNLFELGNTTLVMMKSSYRLQDRKAKINFRCTKHVDAPLGIMVPELLMNIVKEFRSKEAGGTCEWVVHPKRITDTIEVKALCLTKKTPQCS